MAFNKNILKRFFEGKYSKSDYLAITNKLHKEVDDKELIASLQEHWMELNTDSLPEVDVDHILRKLHQLIRINENRKTLKYNYLNYIQRIAAILFFPLAIAFIYTLTIHHSRQLLNRSLVEIQCPMGVRTHFQLPDGSTCYLNSGSTIKYNDQFTDNRMVHLTGEAFFKVVQNKESAFKVRTNNLEIKVLGTEFDVIAWSDENTEEIILNTGKVDIFRNNGVMVTTLSPNQKLVINVDKQSTQVSKVMASEYAGWTEGKLVFRNESMQEVAKRLSRWYNVDVHIEDEELNSFIFHATFVDEQLDQVLKLLSLTAPITYEEPKRELTSDKTYLKRRINIKINKERITQFN